MPPRARRGGGETERNRADTTEQLRRRPRPPRPRPADAGTSGQAHVGGRDPALGVEHALEDRSGWARRSTSGRPGTAPRRAPRPSSTLPARPQSIMATNRSVHTCAVARDRAGATHEHGGEQERVVAAEHREVAGRVGEDLERVGVERAHRLLHAHDVGMVGELEHARGPEVAAGADRDVVDDHRHRARVGDRPEVRDDPGFRRPHVVRHDDERGGERGRAREGLDRGDRLRGAVGARADDELRRRARRTPARTCR